MVRDIWSHFSLNRGRASLPRVVGHHQLIRGHVQLQRREALRNKKEHEAGDKRIYSEKAHQCPQIQDTSSLCLAVDLSQLETQKEIFSHFSSATFQVMHSSNVVSAGKENQQYSYFCLPSLI